MSLLAEKPWSKSNVGRFTFEAEEGEGEAKEGEGTPDEGEEAAVAEGEGEEGILDEIVAPEGDT